MSDEAEYQEFHDQLFKRECRIKSVELAIKAGTAPLSLVNVAREIEDFLNGVVKYEGPALGEKP